MRLKLNVNVSKTKGLCRVSVERARGTPRGSDQWRGSGGRGYGPPRGRSRDKYVKLLNYLAFKFKFVTHQSLGITYEYVC